MNFRLKKYINFCREKEYKIDNVKQSGFESILFNPKNDIIKNTTINQVYINPNQNPNEDIELEALERLVITIPNAVFKYENFIGGGTFGKIVLMRERTRNIVMALKVSESNDEEDISNSLLLNDCNTLKVRYIGKSIIKDQLYLQIGKERYFYFMEPAEGDLRDLKKKIWSGYKTKEAFVSNENNMKLILKIIEEVRKQLVCLRNLNNEYIYTDLKLCNILYSCPDINDLTTFKIFLGDLGSAVNNGIRYTYTYPYPETRIDIDRDIPINKGLTVQFVQENWNSILSCGIGFLLIAFIDNSKILNQYIREIKNPPRRIKTISDYKNFFEDIDLNSYYRSDSLNEYIDPEPIKRHDINTSLLTFTTIFDEKFAFGKKTKEKKSKKIKQKKSKKIKQKKSKKIEQKKSKKIEQKKSKKIKQKKRTLK
jgi:hypothetical protein